MSAKELEREISGRNFLYRTCLPLRQEDSPTDIFEGNKRSSRSRRRNRQPESVEFRYLSAQRKNSHWLVAFIKKRHRISFVLFHSQRNNLP